VLPFDTTGLERVQALKCGTCKPVCTLAHCLDVVTTSCTMSLFCSVAVTVAAARVASRHDHAVLKLKLSAVLVATWPESTSCAVSVTGFAKDTSVEPILWFFENPKRSGGGPVMELYYDEAATSATVTFHNRDGQFLLRSCLVCSLKALFLVW